MGPPASRRKWPAFRDLSSALIAVYDTDFGVRSPTSISRFSDATRQAAAYRAGRVLLAGDAAHIHGPTGGQGIGLGVEDAVNLGWKLAQVIKNMAPGSLLDTYQAERHPATARVLKYTMAMSATQRADARVSALVDVVADLMSVDAARANLAGLHLGLDVCYAANGGHPLVGRRMPDIDVVTGRSPAGVHAPARCGEPGSIALGPWSDRAQLVDASYDEPWELPVIGVVEPPAAVLIRPDGHVAWVGDGTDAGLEEALTHWFGPAAARQC